MEFHRFIFYIVGKFSPLAAQLNFFIVMGLKSALIDNDVI